MFSHGARGAFLLLLSLLATPAGLFAAERPWIEVKSPHFTVVSNAGEKSARKTAWQFEQIRFVFEKLWPWARIPAHTPFVVFAVKDEASIRALAPQYWEVKDGVRPSGVSVEGRDRCYVVLRVDLPTPDAEGINPYMSIYWSYAYLAISSSFGHDFPLWFSRGLSELFSNTIVRDKDILVGRPIRWNLERIAQGGRLLLPQLFAVDRKSRHATDRDDSQMFDAQSWALLHYMAFGEGGQNGLRLQALAELLRAGKTQEVALREAFGDVKVLEERLALYVSGRLFRYYKFDVDVDVSADGFTTRSLPDAESTAARAAILVAMGRPQEARVLVEEARKADGTLAAVDEVDALLLDREDKTEDAKVAYARAVEKGSNNYYVCYRHAQLLWKAQSDRETLGRMESSLERAVRLNPDSADAHAFLADVKVDVEKATPAFALAARAVELEPWDAGHRLVAARVLDRLGKKEDARKVAEIGLALAKNDADRQRAQAFLDYLKNSASAAASFEDANSWATACNGGDAAACGKLVPLLEKKCGDGDGEACGFVAWLRESGKGVAADPFAAFTFYQMACDRGEKRGCTRLAALQARGAGVPKDEPKAKARLEPLCDGGYAEACTELAVIQAGKRTQKDLALAKALLKKGCEGGDPRACQLQASTPK
jgi:TPR repeat protein